MNVIYHISMIDIMITIVNAKTKRKKHSRRVYMHMLMFDKAFGDITDDDDDVLHHMCCAIDSRLNIVDLSTVGLVLLAFELR